MNDPQPGSGLYSDCDDVNNMCPDLCLLLQDNNMVVLDGFCSKECVTAADCVPAPMSDGNVVCIPTVNYCAIDCTADADCPIGMTCESVGINNETMKFCW
ncbi:MAG TPA: hypothetical protein ENK31_04205 [Nannocystis exedens]|nr:hypothetical protein [Nannocystis exedens]